MKGIYLSEVISGVHAKTPCQYTDFIVTGVSTDTRSLQKGDLYIAIIGEKYDGHDFISLAQAKGACAVIYSLPEKCCFSGAKRKKQVSDEHDFPVLKVKDTVKALQDLAAYYRLKFDIPVIAVTGSNGKTTTKNMIDTILSAKYKVFSTDKNYNNMIGLPKSILELDDTYEAAVFELGMNHLGEIEALTQITHPDIAVITNIGKAHIGYLGSIENIRKAKLEILTGLKENGILILNHDDACLSDVSSDIHEVLFAGTEKSKKNTIYAENISAGANPSYFDIHSQEEVYSCTLPAMGKHNVINALLAVSVGQQLGVGIKEAINEIKRFTVSSMRLEEAYIKGVTILKDYYNSSPDSLEAALEVLAGYPSSGKRIAVLGEMHELGEFSEQEHYRFARLCRRLRIESVFFIGEDYKAFQKGTEESGRCFPAGERKMLHEALKKYVFHGFLSEGDVILIKGSRQSRMEDFYESLKGGINAYQSDFKPLLGSPAKLYVDISAVKHNYAQIKNTVGSEVEIMPMVKANAYGSGTDIIANIFRGSKCLAIADIKEAMLIQRILPDTDLMIIYQPPPGSIETIVSENYLSAVSDLDFAEKLDEESKRQSKKSRIHIEVDTGAGRLGVPPALCTGFAEKIKKFRHIVTEGVFMHYCCAESTDESDILFTKHQTALFRKAVSDFESVLGNIPYKHACASAAIFNQNAAHLNMVRPGYILYGYYPDEALRKKLRLKPALKLTSVILQIHVHGKGTPISYNRRFVTKRKSKIATVAVGYSDGLNRRLFRPDNRKNGSFVVNGQKAPIVGSVCMDLTMIDITDIVGEVKVGDEVAVFDNINMTIEEMADICGTIGYEVISQIEDKADRVEEF